MAAIYSTRFFAIHDSVGVASYVVPAGQVAIVRDLDAFWGITTSGNELNFLGSANQVIYQASWGLNDAGWRQWRGRQVFMPGESLILDSSDTTDVTVSGYLLSLP